MIDDPYRVLGLSPTATDDEVKKAYRVLAKKYHPDANPGDKVAETKMKEINAAYDQIVNKDKYASSRRPSSYAGSSRGSSYGGGAYGGYGSGGYGSSGYGGYSSGGYGSGSSGNGTYGRSSTSGSGSGRGSTYQDQDGGWTVWGFPFPFGFGFGGTSGQWGGGFQVKSDPSDNAYMSAARNYINAGNYSEAVNVLNGISDRNARWYYYSAVANLGLGNKIHALQYAQKAYSMDSSNSEYRDLLEHLQQTSQSYQTVGRDYKAPEFSSYTRLLLAFCIIFGLTSLPSFLCNKGGYFCCL